jgi:subfamily B ATP-binding cassette protein MsbA
MVKEADLPPGRWLWRHHLRGQWTILSVAMVLMTIEGAMMGALSWLIRPMFDQVFLGTDTSLVPLIAMAVAGVFTLRALSGFGHQTLLARHSETLSAALQAQVLSHVMIQDIGFFRTNPPGALIERVRGDALAFRGLWQPIVTALGRDVIALLALLGVALWTDWVWTLIAVIGAPLLSWPLSLLQARVNRAATGARVASGVLTTRLDEIFHGIATIRLTGHEAAETARYGRTLADYKRVQMRAETAGAGIPALIDLVAALGFAGVMTYGGYQIMAGDKTVGEFMSFFIAMALIFEPLRRLGAVSGQWAQARAALTRMRSLLNEMPNIQAPAVPQKLDRRGGHRIEIADVHFAYDPASPVLRGLSLTAEPGQMTAMVGPSGAGKSTIFGLIARMVDPGQGQVRLDGIDIRALDPRDLRDRIAVVTQDSALFDETIAWNVAMGNPNLGTEAVLSYLEQAQAAEFVAALPEGADTGVGPRGSALSGGQRQRVAIARALAREAPILLLDEATSALDAQTESRLSDRLAQPQPGRTTIVIAHRLATVRAADCIHVLDRGRVVESGTHDALIARGGLYASLYALQFAETPEAAP